MDRKAKRKSMRMLMERWRNGELTSEEVGKGMTEITKSFRGEKVIEKRVVEKNSLFKRQVDDTRESLLLRRYTMYKELSLEGMDDYIVAEELGISRNLLYMAKRDFEKARWFIMPSHGAKTTANNFLK